MVLKESQLLVQTIAHWPGYIIKQLGCLPTRHQLLEFVYFQLQHYPYWTFVLSSKGGLFFILYLCSCQYVRHYDKLSFDWPKLSFVLWAASSYNRGRISYSYNNLFNISFFFLTFFSLYCWSHLITFFYKEDHQHFFKYTLSNTFFFIINQNFKNSKIISEN